MRARVGVTADDGHAGLGQPQLRPDHVDDPLGRVPDAVDRDAELGTVGIELADLGGGHLVDDRQPAVRRRHRMVGRGHRLARPPDAETARPEARERLRTGHLVDEVEVHREDGRGARILGDDVVVPDLLDDGARFGHAAARGAERGGYVRA